MPPWNNPDGSPNNGCFFETQWELVQPAPKNRRHTRAEAGRLLYQTYFAPVRRVIMERGFGADEAEELTQDFLVKLLYHDGLAGADRNSVCDQPGSVQDERSFICERLSSVWDKLSSVCGKLSSVCDKRSLVYGKPAPVSQK